MRRISTFFFGMIIGGGLLYGAMNFHVIHSSDGMHLVPKVESTLANTYVDVRAFGPRDWVERPQVAVALVNAKQTALMQGSADNTLQNGIDRLLNK